MSSKLIGTNQIVWNYKQGNNISNGNQNDHLWKRMRLNFEADKTTTV